MPSYLLLPAKDEAENLPWILEQAKRVGLLPVVCDDGSQDGTATLAENMGALVLVHPENRGLAEAIRTLLLFALTEGKPGDLFLLMDADGTMDPALYPDLRRVLLEKNAELVIASRFRGGGVQGLSLPRRLFSWAARWYFSMLYPGVGVTDWTTGWRLYTYGFLKRYSEAYPFLFCSQGFVAQTEILLRALGLNPRVRVVEVGAVVRYDLKKGKSKMQVFRTAWEYLRLGLLVKGSSFRKGRHFWC